MPHLARHDGRVRLLRPNTLVGRREPADLILPDPRVSTEHASLRWTHRGWVLRDLGSRNGTRVNGRPMEAGQSVLLAVGDEVAFGCNEERWRLEDSGPPVAFARGPGGVEVQAHGELLALPDDDGPQVVVLRDAKGWLLDHVDSDESPESGAAERVESGDQVRVGEASWTLHLPEEVTPTTEDQPAPRGIDHVSLEFSVSLDEEHVRICGMHGEEPLDLGARAHHYLLLILARRRAADAESDDALPASEHGWIYSDELARMLRMRDQAIYLQVHRARRQLADAGVPDAAGLIERRPASRQLRIGVGHLCLQTAT